MKKIGRITKANIECNKILRQRWIDRGLSYCEIRLPGCRLYWPLQNVHRHKRIFYKGKVEELTKDNEVVLGCGFCHEKVEDNTELREWVFKRIRDNKINKN